MKFLDVLSAAQIDVLADLQERDTEERRRGIRDPISLKALAPEVAELFFLLIAQKNAKTIVEFGTSHGYSTIYLAAAAEITDGRVYTVDAMPEKTALATKNLEAAGLLHRVTLATSDGADFASSLPDKVDFVLVDYGIPAFAPVFDALREKMAPRCLNFIDGGPEGYLESDVVRGFITTLEEDPDYLVTVLPMRRKDQIIAVRVAE